ncbi:MAG: helix-turn-helix domain-containing protein [Candidatus Omnitrophica bacterium]|nr:helix-turn-helix domain-containing protein [Candidatus Omnitrophota bacterium]
MMNKFLTFEEAAHYLGMPEADLQKVMEKGKLPAYKIGGIYTRFKVEDLNAYRRRIPKKTGQKYPSNFGDSVKDFLYFNDFYIYSGIAIALILYFIFK